MWCSAGGRRRPSSTSSRFSQRLRPAFDLVHDVEQFSCHPPGRSYAACSGVEATIPSSCCPLIEGDRRSLPDEVLEHTTLVREVPAPWNRLPRQSRPSLPGRPTHTRRQHTGIICHRTPGPNFSLRVTTASSAWPCVSSSTGLTFAPDPAAACLRHDATYRVRRIVNTVDAAFRWSAHAAPTAGVGLSSQDPSPSTLTPGANIPPRRLLSLHRDQPRRC
jgi:hypothetical protein